MMASQIAIFLFICSLGISMASVSLDPSATMGDSASVSPSNSYTVSTTDATNSMETTATTEGTMTATVNPTPTAGSGTATTAQSGTATAATTATISGTVTAATTATAGATVTPTQSSNTVGPTATVSFGAWISYCDQECCAGGLVGSTSDQYRSNRTCPGPTVEACIPDIHGRNLTRYTNCPGKCNADKKTCITDDSGAVVQQPIFIMLLTFIMGAIALNFV